MRLVLIAAAAALLFPAAVFAQNDSGSGAADKQAIFTTPSNNIECTYTPQSGTEIYKPEDGGPELQCDRAQPSYVRVVLGKSGPAQRTDNPGEQPCCSADPVVAYGQTWKGGPFVCHSEKTGPICERDDGHGMFISGAKVSVH
ncbi:MAG TPA: hypothetical protein VHW02_10545 [Rhizomicrobium sp.]|jgi:hypothetical protein|nr:hypothetical protein [Rhizomicrobium sp.]